MSKSIEELVHAITETQDGQRNAMQKLEDAAREAKVNLRFWPDLEDDDRYYYVDSSGPYEHYHGEDYPVNPDEYLDALREDLIQKLDAATQSKDDLEELIQRFTKKKVGHRELKEAIRAL